MLEEIDDGLWCTTGEHSLGPVNLGCRMTILRRNDGGLVLHSPIARTDALEEAVTKLGEVKAIFAPNLYHHLFIQSWLDALGGVDVFGPDSLTSKQPQLTSLEPLSAGCQAELDLPGEVLHVPGMPKLDEYVYLHESGRTMVVADAFFNMLHDQSLAGSVVTRGMGTYKRFAVSRMLKTISKDKAATGAAMHTLVERAPDNLVLAHGENLIGGAAEKMRAAVEERF